MTGAPAARGAPAAPPRPAAARRWWAAGLAFAILLGALLRWHGLGREGYWGDEIISVEVARMPVAQLLANRAKNHNPPLYFLLLKGWVARFGDGEAATRALSLLFGVLAVPAIALLGAELFSPAAGAWAALLLALSPLHLRYTQETRAYSLLVLLAILSFLLFARVLRRGRARDIAGLFALNVILVYTHLSAWLLVAAQAAAFPLLARGGPWAPPLRRWWLLQGGILLASAPWWAALAFTWRIVTARKAQIHGVLLGEGGRPEDLAAALRAIAGSAPALALLAATALLGLLALPGLRAVGPPGERRWRLAAGLWLLVGMAGPVALALVLPLAVRARYLIAGLPALLLLAGAGLDRVRPAVARAVLLAALILPSGAAVARQYREPVRVPWREAFRVVAEGHAPGDLVLLAGFSRDTGMNGLVRHYLKRRGIPSSRAALRFVEERAPERVWVVVAPAAKTLRQVPARRTAAALAKLGKRLPLEREWSFNGIRVLRFGRAAPAGAAPGG